MSAKLLQLCQTLCDPMNCSLPGSSAHGICLARILEWVVFSFYRGFSQHRDWTHISCIGRQIVYHWATSRKILEGLTEKVDQWDVLGTKHIELLLSLQSFFSLLRWVTVFPNWYPSNRLLPSHRDGEIRCYLPWWIHFKEMIPGPRQKTYFG